MSLFDDAATPAPDTPPVSDPDDGEPTGRGRGPWRIIIGVAVVAVAAGSAYLWLSPAPPEEPVTVVEERPAAPPPPPPAEPEPEPEPAPPPAPPPAPEPEPEPAPEPAAAPVGVLRVSSDVDGASVFLDREYLGTTPLDVADLPPGRHQLNVSAEGYDGIAQSVEISDEPVELMVRFRVVRLNQAVPVTHRHRFGSCTGTLVANLEGIHYETTHDDGFSRPLSEIEEFEVDYLEHNLRLKLRGGRTYNFTDEQETADALFVFHREVDRAMSRLAQGDPPAERSSEP